MKENSELFEIDIRRLLTVLWSRAWIIVLSGVLLAGLAFGYAWFFVTPTYRATTQMYVNNNYSGGTSVSSSQIVAAQDLADTYMVILESRSMLNEVIERTGVSYTYQTLKDMISAEAVNGTEIFEVQVTCTSSALAARIANAIADILPGKIAAVIKGSSVGVIDYAVEDPSPVGPNYRTFILIGAFLGMILSAAAVVIADLLNTVIRSEDYLAHNYEALPLLAVIPDAQSTKTGYYKGYYESNSKSAQKVRR